MFLTVTLLMGGLIGFIAGLVGIGGSSLIAAGLVWLFTATGAPLNEAVKTAFGTSLVIGSLTALTGFFVHKNRTGPQWEIVLPLTISVVIGSFVGASTASIFVEGRILKFLFGLALLVISIYMILASNQSGSDSKQPPSKTLLVFTGLAIGFFASAVGMGGAIFTSITFVKFFRYPIHKIVGITTFVQTFGALSGAIGYVLNGYINWYVAFLMLCGGIPCAYLGAKLAHKLQARHLRRAFGIILFLVALKMFF